MTRWSLVVNNETDQSLRAFLGQKGAKKGDLSKFVEEAVLDKLLAETAEMIKERNAADDQMNIMSTVNEALEAVRAHSS
ncbi:hypothetical protein AB835_05935 [Candidatus Endobugula sertula]|uniref:XACb0070 ribbon-helix-helix domain-containing protein n=1 Tax=Candidatus Endobugula sertula TaxID=62101 RepID=A0A1D2QR30_9GAMM|nr:hypothetical protein AB835_05935 [Candidatus Endobugula sertula]